MFDNFNLTIILSLFFITQIQNRFIWNNLSSKNNSFLVNLNSFHIRLIVWSAYFFLKLNTMLILLTSLTACHFVSINDSDSQHLFSLLIVSPLFHLIFFKCLYMGSIHYVIYIEKIDWNDIYINLVFVFNSSAIFLCKYDTKFLHWVFYYHCFKNIVLNVFLTLHCN